MKPIDRIEVYEGATLIGTLPGRYGMTRIGTDGRLDSGVVAFNVDCCDHISRVELRPIIRWEGGTGHRYLAFEIERGWELLRHLDGWQVVDVDGAAPQTQKGPPA